MIKVLNLRNLIKYSFKIIIPLIVLLIIINLLFNTKSNKNLSVIDGKAVTGIIDEGIDLLKLSKEEKQESEVMEWGKVIIDSEFDIINSKDNEKEFEDNIENITIDETSENQETTENIKNDVEQAKLDVNTEVVPNSVNPKYNRDYEGVRINNSTEYELSDDLLNTSNIEVNKSKVLIYHTHTCESYTPTEQFSYEETGSYRTTDLNYSVARVGDELESQLSSYGCNVIHDKTYHDYPSYNGSYSRSLATAESILAENQDIDIVIDLHRDAIGDSSYAPKVKIGEEYASQLMFVIGTDKANPSHTTWDQNLRFAVKTQEKANELYPGLFKPIILRNSTYNQNVAKAACIIEVGATGNTLEESLNSMKYLAKILQEI